MPFPRLLTGLAVVALLGLTSPAFAEDDAASFIAQTGHAVLGLARDQNLSDQQLKERLRTIADQDFDSPRIAQFVLGRHWRSASDVERQQFVKAFEEFMVQVYATRFRQYSGAIFKVLGQRQDGDSATVSTEFDQANGQPPAKVIWQVVKQPNGYKITDVSIEGISQAVTYRQEFSSVIEQHGGQVSALTQELLQKAHD
jgi:phospholipid transport system substrate-binding protein